MSNHTHNNVGDAGDSQPAFYDFSDQIRSAIEGALITPLNTADIPDPEVASVINGLRFGRTTEMGVHDQTSADSEVATISVDNPHEYFVLLTQAYMALVLNKDPALLRSIVATEFDHEMDHAAAASIVGEVSMKYSVTFSKEPLPDGRSLVWVNPHVSLTLEPFLSGPDLAFISLAPAEPSRTDVELAESLGYSLGDFR